MTETPRFHGEGLRVSLHRIDQTQKGLLKQPFRFQVPPTNQLEESYGFTHQEYPTIGLGTFSRPQGRDLRQVSFATLVVDEKYPWTLLDPQDNLDWTPDPIAMKEDLVDILESGTPFLLVIHQRHYDGSDDVNWPATLRSMRVDQQPGEIGTRYLDVSFSEWRDPTVQRRLKGAPSSGPPKSKRHLPATVTLTQGRGKWESHTFSDPTLYDLARFFYGSPSRWRAIANKNKLNISGNRHLWDAHNPLPAPLKQSKKVIVPKLG